VPAFPLPVSMIAGSGRRPRSAVRRTSPLYAGQAIALAREVPAAELLGSWMAELTST
jgi:hypothetical protein